MKKRGAIELSTGFIVILIISIVVFGFGIYIVKKFFGHAENIKMTYDERTEKEIEKLLDDGSRVAIPFDKKTINNGEFKTFGVGVLNTLNIGPSNEFEVSISFNKAFDKDNNQICEVSSQNNCGNPDAWLQTTAGTKSIVKTVKNNEQEKFLIGVNVKNAPRGVYVFDLLVCYNDNNANNNNPSCIGIDANFPDIYDALHKLYVEVP